MTDVARALRVRVWVPDVWDVVPLTAGADWTVARLKEEALRRGMARPVDGADYEVKFRGAPVVDENITLGALKAPDGAPFIVLAARRRPVR